MKLCNDFIKIENLNYSEVLIVFKLTEVSRSCPKQIIHIFQLSQQICRWRVFRSSFEKRIQENYVYKEPCVLKEK